MRTYDPIQYWQKRGTHYREPRAPRDELRRLAGLVRQLAPSEILEVGSGAGRILTFLRGAQVISQIGANFAMCDFVDSMRDACERRTGVRPDAWDGVRLPYPDRAFDMVISFSVLLHVPPADLGRIWAEHVRVARRWIYVATMAQRPGPGLAPHCFDHMYGHLFDDLRVVERCTFSEGRRVHWLLEI